MAQEIADSKLIDTWSSDGLKVKPDVSKIIEGWQLGEQPPHEYMNWLQNTFGSKLNHILKNGVAKWNNETTYLAGSSVQHNGNVWLCKSDNTNSEPTDINNSWENTKSNKSANTINDLKTKSSDVINVLGYHTKGDGGGGLFYWDSTSTEADNGGTIIQATGITTGRWKRVFSGAVNVKWFGAVESFVIDSTQAIQNAIEYVKATQLKSLLISGKYAVSQIIFDSCNSLDVICDGGLIGKPSGNYDAVLVIKNSAGINFTGSLAVSASYNIGYASAIALYTDNNTQASTMMFNNVSCVGAKLGWKFGRETEQNALISEISVFGGYLYGCPSCVEAVGTQTVINFIGTNLITGTNGGDSNWQSLPRICIKTKGAYVGVTSGEALIVDINNGLLTSIEPILSPEFGNQYGAVVYNGVLIESASQYCKAHNPDNIPNVPVAIGRIQFINCSGYHSGNSFHLVETASDFTGKVIIKNNNFHAPVYRTQPNVVAYGRADIYMDDYGFGVNFAKGLSSAQGGILHFTNRVIWRASNSNNQALIAGQDTTVVFKNYTATDDTNRYYANYSFSTGIFTVPIGGLKDVNVKFMLRTNQPAHPVGAFIYVNGVFFGFNPISYNGGTVSGDILLGNLPEGTTIEVKVNQQNTNAILDGGMYEYMAITARN